MNDLICFVLVGGVICIMDSTYLFIDWIPVQVIHEPRYSISVCPKNDFYILHLSLLYLIFFSVSSNLSK